MSEEASNPETPPWHSLSAQEATRTLAVDPSTGLSAQEARTRLEQYGTNELIGSEKAPWYQVFARQFASILIGILAAAAAISFVIGEFSDGISIVVIVALNGILGFVQEWKAERALEELQQMLSPTCMVLREGTEQRIEAAELVPGDIVLLETGARIPADLRLIEALQLKADESSLTGESDSVAKSLDPLEANTPLAERACMTWMGTTITNGRARGVVVGTGMESEFGRIARLTEGVTVDTTPLQEKLGELGRTLGIISVAVTALVVGAGIAVGKPAMEMFLTGISLAVAVVPEGLPAVVTITLALGIRAMVRRRALLRRLQAAEALGAASVICTDKTGTLTQNEMTVLEFWLAGGAVQVTGTGYAPEGSFQSGGEDFDPAARADLMDLLRTALNCNHAHITRDEHGRWVRYGEPTEAALLVAAHKAGLGEQDLAEVEAEIPFNSSRKRMTVIVKSGDRRIAHVKGAPEVILERCTQIQVGDQVLEMNEERRAQTVAAYEGMANQGLRTLALARREFENDVVLDHGGEPEQALILVGIAGIIDPPRPEVPAAIAECHSAGINLLMITGDSPKTAAAIAKKIGLPAQHTVTGPQLDAMSESELKEIVATDAVFARVTPEHKLRLVGALQEQGEVVAMTGDGVNDAPALKKADIGIAMGIRGTDVAKGASDMVLTDDNFASIVGAVEEGRRQYDNIQKFVRYLLTTNWGELLLIFLSILIGGPLVLLPVQILWVNLVTDGISAIALGLEPVEAGVMGRPPRKQNEPILNRGAVIQVLALGTYEGLATLWLFYYFQESGSLALARTAAFTGLVVLELVNVFNFRALRAPLHYVGFFSNPWLLAAVSLNVALQIGAVHLPGMEHFLKTEPLALRDWGLILLVASPLFISSEVLKWIRWRGRSE